jgi:hypothetical protein
MVCTRWNKVVQENIEFFSNFFMDEDDDDVDNVQEVDDDVDDEDSSNRNKKNISSTTASFPKQGK